MEHGFTVECIFATAATSGEDTFCGNKEAGGWAMVVQDNRAAFTLHGPVIPISPPRCEPTDATPNSPWNLPDFEKSLQASCMEWAYYLTARECCAVAIIQGYPS